MLLFNEVGLLGFFLFDRHFGVADVRIELHARVGLPQHLFLLGLLGLTQFLPVVHLVLIGVVGHAHLLHLTLAPVHDLLLVLLLRHLLLNRARVNLLVKPLHLVILSKGRLNLLSLLLVLVCGGILIRHDSLRLLQNLHRLTATRLLLLLL